MHAEFEDKGLLLAREFSHRVAQELIIEDTVLLNKQLSQLIEKKDLLYASLYESTGLRLVSQSNIKINHEIVISPEDTRHEDIIKRIFIGNGRKTSILNICVPVRYEKDIIGWLQIGISLERIYTETQKRIINLSLFVIGFILLGLFASYIFARSLTKPINELLVGVKKIGQGDLSYKVKINRIDEIGELSVAINDMSDELLHKTTSIENLNKVIKERELAEDKLRQSQKMEAIGQLAGGVAHDLNNMLGAITGSADLIKLKCSDIDPSFHEYLKVIIDATKRSSDLVSNLLAFARKGKYEKKAFDLHNTIDDGIKLLEHSLVKSIKIQKNFQAVPSIIIGDSSQLEHSILNLAVNAADAMSKGGILLFKTEIVEFDPKIMTSNYEKIEEGTYLLLTVSDTGCGMDDETINNIFDPFFTTKETGKGTGLGLSSVYGAIKNHGGFVDVESRVEEGSKLKIYLPLPKDGQEILRKDTVIPSELIRGKEHILIIDDEEMVIQVSRRIFEHLGYLASTFTNGFDAIEYYKQNYKNIDLVIIDLLMPEISGYETFIELRKINPDIVTIISSGYSMNDEVEQMLNNGGHAFIQKPYTVSTISQVLVDVLGKKAS